MNNKPGLDNKNTSLVLNKKHLSHIVSLLLIVAFLIFFIGYFLGKHKAIQEISDVNKQDFFSDQMHYAFQRLHVTEKPDHEACDPIISSQQAVLTDETITSSKFVNNGRKQNGECYYAQLISFGTQKGAQEFVNRLQRNGINTTIIKHKAQVPNSSGITRIIHWYQVVTDSYCNQEELKYYIAGIQKIVKLNDVRIVKVDNGRTS